MNNTNQQEINSPSNKFKHNLVNYDKQKSWNDYEYPQKDTYDTKYKVNKNKELVFLKKDKNGNESEELVSRTPFVLCGKTKPLADGTVYFTIRYDNDKLQKEFQAKQSDLLIKNSLKLILAGHGINVPDNNLLNKTQEYISLCIQEYGERLKTIEAVVSNGWNEDCTLFALGETGISVNGIEPINTVVPTPYIEPLHKRGILSDWVEGVTPIMKYDLSRFLFYDSMTAPLKKP